MIKQIMIRILLITVFSLIITVTANAETWTLIGSAKKNTGSIAAITNASSGVLVKCGLSTFQYTGASQSVVLLSRTNCDNHNHGQSATFTIINNYWYKIEFDGVYYTIKYSTDYSVEPEYCTDGEITGDEEGYDCGGSCASACVATCKEGTVPYEDPSGTRCIQEVATDNYGNCPNLTEWYYYPASESSNAFCSKVTDPYLGKTVVTLPAAGDPWKKEITTTTTGSVSVVDNGDGTSTKTETSLATGTDGKTTQSTTTSTINNTTGDTINKSTVNQFITSNPDNAWSEDAKLIVEAVNNLKEEIDPNVLTNISTASDLASTGAADGMLDAVSLEFDTIADEYENEMDSWIKPETITTTGKNLLPTPVSGCTDFTFSMSDGRSIKTISCDALYKIRAMLDMVFALLLFMYLYALVFQEDIVKGG